MDVDRVDERNILDVLKLAAPIHEQNKRESQHLFDVYAGKQAILNRTKAVRPEINNRLMINHANEIVSFQVSYLLSDPITYVSRGTRNVTDKVNALNEMMFLNNKAARDKEIADHFKICGNAYRLVLPEKNTSPEDPPFAVYTLDPRNTFVVYSSAIGEPAICGVYETTRRPPGKATGSSEKVYSVYTRDRFIEIVNWEIRRIEPLYLGMVPIIEYVNNNARIGAFEVVETVLDAMNTLASNRVDATEQVVQALTVFKNCDITSEDFAKLKEMGAIKIKSGEGMQSDVYMLTADLKQTDQQVLMDSLYDEILRITGMPSQAMGNTSDSSNNGAVIVRNGWYNAEARAKDTELLWRESEGQFLKLALKICRDMNRLDLNPADIVPKFTRRNYEDIQVRSQVLTTMLSNPMIAPRLAFNHCGMFVDSESAYRESMDYYKEHQAEVERMVESGSAGNPEANASNNEQNQSGE